MSALGPRFSQTGDAKVFAGEVLTAELAFTGGGNSTIDLAGRQFALTISRAADRTELVSVAGEVTSDSSDNYVSFAVDGDTTEDLYTQYRSVGLRVEISELLDTGRDVWVEGALRIISSAATVVPATPNATSAPVARFVYDYTTRRTIISARGAPGLAGSSEASEAAAAVALAAAAQVEAAIAGVPTQAAAAVAALVADLTATIADLRIGPSLNFANPDNSMYL
jgi:hypothetical protein